MCTNAILPSPKAADPAPPPPAIEQKSPDIQISAKKKKTTTSSRQPSGLNRFLIVPGSAGSGANVPE